VTVAIAVVVVVTIAVIVVAVTVVAAVVVRVAIAQRGVFQYTGRPSRIHPEENCTEGYEKDSRQARDHRGLPFDAALNETCLPGHVREARRVKPVAGGDPRSLGDAPFDGETAHQFAGNAKREQGFRVP
jgi:hypothetical protein